MMPRAHGTMRQKREAPCMGALNADRPSGADVAVVVTTFNDHDYLADALQSIVSQTCAPAEIIVVDDGSHVVPYAIVSQFPDVRLVCQANSGLSSARNAGMRVARSEFITF